MKIEIPATVHFVDDRRVHLRLPSNGSVVFELPAGAYLQPWIDARGRGERLTLTVPVPLTNAENREAAGEIEG